MQYQPDISIHYEQTSIKILYQAVESEFRIDVSIG